LVGSRCGLTKYSGAAHHGKPATVKFAPEGVIRGFGRFAKMACAMLLSKGNLQMEVKHKKEKGKAKRGLGRQNNWHSCGGGSVGQWVRKRLQGGKSEALFESYA
jgi:hypothetical protein